MESIMKKIVLIIIIVIIRGNHSSLYPQTNIPPGDVYGTWGISGSPYHILGDITIPNDSSLFIEPGVYLQFEEYFALNHLYNIFQYQYPDIEHGSHHQLYLAEKLLHWQQH